MSRADRFLKACRKEPTDATPIWLMRQAGRYMANYRELRAKHPFLEMVKTPELACEVTLQPIDAFDLDAAIIFADILPLLEGMGMDLEFVKGDGPVLHNPIRSAADVASLVVPEVREALDYTIEAVRMTRQELAGRVPLIGFSGAPFTLAAYAIEGGGSKDFNRAKQFMHQEPKAWHELMDKLSRAIGEYLKAQIEAGAQAVQLFDSWIGALSPFDFREHVLPYIRRALQMARNGHDVPVIYFGTGTAGLLPLLSDCGATVVGVDWRIDLMDAWDMIGHDLAVQGNLDPHLLLAPHERLKPQAIRLLDAVNGRAGHIFNIGHGIIKETPVEHVAALVDLVHSYSQNRQSTDKA